MAGLKLDKIFNNKKRILFLTTVAKTLHAFLMPIAIALKKKGWKVDAGAANIYAIPQLRNVFDKCHEIPWYRNPFHIKNLKSLVKLRNLIGQYDIIHVHTPVASFFTRLAYASLFNFKAKLIYTAHGFHFHPEGNLLKNSIYLIAEKITGRLTNYLIVINDEDFQVAKRYKLLPLEHLIRMYGVGIDTNFYDPARVLERTMIHLKYYLKIPIKAPIITMIAEFNNNKRHIDLIIALSMIIKKKEIYTLFVGDGPLVLKSKQLVEKLNLSHYIRFLGYRKDIRSLIKISTIVVLPSLREGLPVTVMEALSMETAVIATNIRGTRELLSNGCGLIIPPRSPQNLANAILTIIDNPNSAKKLGKKGRKKMQEKYEVSKIISQHNDIYESLLVK